MVPNQPAQPVDNTRNGDAREDGRATAYGSQAMFAGAVVCIGLKAVLRYQDVRGPARLCAWGICQNGRQGMQERPPYTLAPGHQVNRQAAAVAGDDALMNLTQALPRTMPRKEMGWHY